MSNKKAYQTKEIAEDALIDTHMNFEFRAGDGPIAVYLCEDCGYYHFTSRAPMNQRLSDMIKSGKVNKQREANAWLTKFKK